MLSANLHRSGITSVVLAALLTFMSGSAGSYTVTQSPLQVGGNVPGNLLLVPSVEYPTLDSMANLGDYSAAREYVGYFDPRKCYRYSYSATETDRHFYPVGAATNHACSSTLKEWSGNYMNWAATQTIDPFRKALTGGYRVRDTTSETWLEKARYDGNGANSIYPDRRIPASGDNSTLVSGATPATFNYLNIRIWQLNNKMRFTRSGTIGTTTPTIYNPSTHTSLDGNTVYEVSVRVKVCDASVGVEQNCKQYSGGWKPEGLIQKYSERIRFSVFGYLNDSNMLRDGGVLRARQKFVGANKIDPAEGVIANANREWDPDTGQLVRNPDSADATATGANIADSGVINYINKFGQMTTQNHKSHDPVSELYYTAIRYLKHQSNVAEYSSLTGTAAQRFDLADGFPVISNWDDPIQYWCQNNAILGIGDANTHRDKNLPGNTRTNDEPTVPSAVSGDTTVNAVTATAKVAALEGITINLPFTGRENSAYIAGLAYDSHTRDLRGDHDETQTVSTHWVDVREAQRLEARASNQYWLAAKYGGFAVPEGFSPYATTTTAIDATTWSSGETLSTGDVRPENFYVASEADKMVESLTRAFAKIAAESTGSAASLAANSTRLETDTKTFQAQFKSGTWSGELKAFAVRSNGQLETTPQWRASLRLAATTWSTRKIYTYNPQAAAGARYVAFEWANLGSNQTAALGSSDVVNYLRGDRSREESQSSGTLRTRTNVLGDIVNSTPVYVGRPNPRLFSGATFTGASAYAAFATAQANRTKVVYVGANDGMLHGFNADNGNELYAYVPNAAILNGLRSYSDPAYEHRYLVDGEIAVADAYLGSAWKTVLVGTLGRGGPGVFALDVTDPSDVKFLWEKRGTDIAALGKNIGKPVIAQVANGDWRVLLGNGPRTASGTAQLVSIALSDGSVTVTNTDASTENALTAVLARDSGADGFADVAYAGDLLGNVWKFSGLGGTASASKLFEAKDPDDNPQPITAAPLAGKDPATGNVWVFVGTGKFLDTPDLSSTQVQTWYGLMDGAQISGRSELVEREITAEGVVANIAVRAIETGTASEMDGRRGWFMDLVSPVRGEEGERMVLPNRFQGTALIGTTRIPEAEDACRPAGKGYVMAIDPFTGSRLAMTFFDVNGDGLFNEADKLVDENGDPINISGIGTESSPSSPIFVGDMMHVGLDDGSTTSMRIQNAGVQAARMNWRELLNQ